MNRRQPAKLRWAELWQSSFVGYRRYLLDRCLLGNLDQMQGVVIDLGGKKLKKRGHFRPPNQFAENWFYVNISTDTLPDVLADVGQVPFREGSADCVLCIEVLEHLPNPQVCVNEAHRLLKSGGVFLASIPFLYPVHADPSDFQRLTEDGLQRLCHNFSSVRVECMGGFLGVIGMLVELAAFGLDGEHPVQIIIRRCMKALGRLLCWVDDHNDYRWPIQWKKFTTGYFIEAVK